MPFLLLVLYKLHFDNVILLTENDDVMTLCFVVV